MHRQDNNKSLRTLSAFSIVAFKTQPAIDRARWNAAPVTESTKTRQPKMRDCNYLYQLVRSVRTAGNCTFYTLQWSTIHTRKIEDRNSELRIQQYTRHLFLSSTVAQTVSISLPSFRPDSDLFKVRLEPRKCNSPGNSPGGSCCWIPFTEVPVSVWRVHVGKL